MDAKAEKLALFRYGLIAPLVLETLPRGDFLLAASQKVQDLAFVFTALVSFHAEKNRRRPSSLGNEDRLPCRLDLFQGCCGVLPKIGDGNDYGNLSHKGYLQKYV